VSFNPTFSTSVSDINRNRTVYAENLNAFPSPVSGVITLEDGVEYIRTQPINFGSNQIKTPTGGRVQLGALNSPSNIMLTELTGNTPLFIGDVNRLQIMNTILLSLNLGGNLFDISANTINSVVVVNNSAFAGFNSLGILDGGNFDAENMGWLGFAKGLTLNDVNIVNIAEQQFNQVEPTTLEAIIEILGASFDPENDGDHFIITGSLNKGIFNRIFASPITGSAVFNIDSAATIGSINITDSIFDPINGGDWFDPAGLDQTDPKVISLNNTNVIDSNWIGSLGFKENTTVTTISTQDVYVDIDGTIVEVDLERFTRSGAILTYIGLEDIKASIKVSMSILRESGNAPRLVRAAIFINGVEQHSASVTMRGETKVLSFNTNTLLVTDDTINVQIKNTNFTENIIVVDYNLAVNKT